MHTLTTDAGLLPDEIEALLIKGAYPQLYAQNIDGALWCSNYISTYIEKDVRQLLKITDVLRFQRFLQLCAARVGNQINYSELARDADMSPHTVKEWLSVLETSYIIKLITPHYKNFSKRITKQPKLYFYDSALVCSLLNIRTKAEMFVHPLKGALVESFVISEIIKYNYNNNKRPDIYFWRDVQGHEIDCIIEKSYNVTIPIEVKASKTISQDFFKGLKKWQEITAQDTVEGYVVYAGENTMEWKNGYLWGWNNIKAMLERIYK